MRVIFLSLLLLYGLPLWSQQPLGCDDAFVATGNALQQGECVRMTSNTADQQGCIWFQDPVDFSQPLSHSMVFNFGTNDDGADGICLVYQANDTAQCGLEGDGIGAAGIPNSFIIEFDTYQNTDIGDPVADHISIGQNGDLTNFVQPPFSLPNIEDGNDYLMTFNWDPSNNAYEVIFDGVTIYSSTFDIINNCFGGATQVYWGYTASTGGHFNEQRVCPGIPPLPTVDAEAVGASILSCANPIVTLDGGNSEQGADITYQWTDQAGNIVSNAITADVTTPGMYTLTVFNTVTNCEAQTSINVSQAEGNLDVTIQPPSDLTCERTSVVLSTNVSPDLSFAWSTANGVIAGATTLPTATVTAPGSYTLTVTDTATGCTGIASTTVRIDTTAPSIQIEPHDPINCEEASVELEATVDLRLDELSINWSSTDGSINLIEPPLLVEISETGTYQVTATSNVNGCTATASTLVTTDTIAPIFTVIADDTLNCNIQRVVIQANPTNAIDDPQYQWATVDGVISGPDEASIITATEAGTYEVTLTDGTNGCSNTQSITLTADTDFPVADSGPNQELNCSNTTVLLGGSNTSTGPLFNYQWSTPNSSINGSGDSTTLLVNQRGTYYLDVTNISNGCTSSDTVRVGLNTSTPFASITPPAPITCSDSVVILDGISSTDAGILSYQWSALTGSLVGDTNETIATAAQAGLYQLIVTNTSTSCSDTTEVTVVQDIDFPDIQIDPPSELTCTTTEIQLNSQISSQSGNTSFSWFTEDGNFSANSTTSQPTVDTVGTYFLQVVDLDNECVTLDSVVVLQNDRLPTAEAGNTEPFTCATTSIQLDGSASTLSNATYQWTTVDGEILNDSTSLFPLIGSPGTYVLAVTDLLNGCSATDTLTVTSDDEAPNVQIASPTILDCEASSVVLDGTATSGAHPLTFTWSSVDGLISGNTDEATSATEVPGTYQLIANDLVNFCSDTATVVVLQDTLAPTLSITEPMIFNCEITSQVLSATVSNASLDDLSINWLTTDGTIMANENSLSPTITGAGVYTLQVTNTNNNCSNSQEVIITEDLLAPTISIAPPGTLTCAQDTVQLNASGSDNGTGFTISWSTPNGQILTGNDQLQPIVNEAGDYRLVIQNIENNCESTATVSVAENVIPPTANAGTDVEFNCAASSGSLDGSGSSAGPNFVYQWLGFGGQPVNNAQTLSPVVNQEGLYQLTVLDLTNGCTAVDQVNVSQDAPLAEITFTEPRCFGETGTISFSNLQGGSSPYLYSVNGGESLVTSDFFDDLPAGTYATVVEDSNGCIYEENIVITQPAAVRVLLEEEIEIILGDSIPLVPQVNYPVAELPLISWDNSAGLSCNDCLFPWANPTNSTIYRLSVATAAGCTEEAEVRIFVRRDVPIYIPNAFNPTGQNPLFFPYARASAVHTIRSFRIYTRWGELVHEAVDVPPNDPEGGWDGRHQGQLMDSAVFVYVAEVELANGQVEVIQGDVVLVK